MKDDMKYKLDYDCGTLEIDEQDGTIIVYDSPYITLENDCWVEQDIDGDFIRLHRENGDVIYGDAADEILDQYRSYIDDCIDAIAEKYVAKIKNSTCYSDKDVFATERYFYEANRGIYEIIHWVTGNALIVTYSDYHENFFRKYNG